MGKTEIYSWRLSQPLKSDLEAAARSANMSLADLLEEIARGWLRHGRGDEDPRLREEKMREAAAPFIGSIEGSDPSRAENARTVVRDRIAGRHGR